MPILQKILFIDGKVRDDVNRYWLDNQSGQYRVIFSQGDGMAFSYHPSKIDIAVKVSELKPPFRVSRKNDGQIFRNVLGVNVFKGEKHTAYRVLFENGSAKNYPADYLNVEEHIEDSTSLSVLDYLREVAQYSVIPINEENTISLADKFNRIPFVGKGSLMASFLNPHPITNARAEIPYILFPFGCNSSQYDAVCKAMQNELSVIQGPPGTGKTQTILNILANLILQGKTMEIVSNNNSAVANILEKLEKEGLGFMVAYLGRSDNKKQFISNQTGTYPDMESWKIDDADSLKIILASLSVDLQQLYKKQEKAMSLDSLINELSYQQELYGRSDVPDCPLDASKILNLLHRCQCEMSSSKHRLKLITRFLLWRAKLSNDKHNPPLSTLEGLYYKRTLESLRNEKSMLEKEVEGIDEKSKSLREMSMAVFKDAIARKYSKNTSRPIFDEHFSRHTPEFIKEYPIVLSTTFSATSNISSDYKFDYLIMDEASQVDVAAGAVALSCAKNAVIVGDLKQLPNVVDSRMEELSNAVFMKYDISESYRFSSNSFLSAVCGLMPDVATTLLKEHYRCAPQIIGFCNKQFYGGDLTTMTHKSGNYPSVRVVRTSAGNHARGTINERQVDVIMQEILPPMVEMFSSIGIIAPYNNQVSAISKALRSSHYENVQVATVHKFQGREMSAIILSTVDNVVGEFADDPHLMNVAVSRAKDQFVLVVSRDEQPNGNIRDLIDYIEYYNGEAEQSKLRSVFDLLYTKYTDQRIEFLKSHPRVSEYDSENLMYGYLQDILCSEGLSDNYGVLIHYPLRLMIPDGSSSSSIGVSDDVFVYANRSWTHLDFLLYSKVTHKAVLAIEVDGHMYHRDSSIRSSKIQSERDIKKDAFLEAINLPLLRLSTTGSSERERILRFIN